MQFLTHRTSGKPCPESVVLNTLEDLLEFIKEHGDIVIFARRLVDCPEIEIYDDHRE